MAIPPVTKFEQLAKIRSNVNRFGAAVVQWHELRVLCPEDLSPSECFLRIVEITREESWAFEFLRDGAVRFSSLPVAPRLSSSRPGARRRRRADDPAGQPTSE
ncbi:MAG: hypothetical protein ACJ8KU_10465 [Chthoniobacterales bacterium]